MHNIEIQQKFSKTSPIHQKSLTPLSAIMKFRIPILTNVLNIYTPQPQQRIILKKHDITLSPWSKSMLPWEQQNTGMQKSPNQNHWSPNLSWMMIFVAKIFQLSKKKTSNAHKFTSAFEPFVLATNISNIIFFETKGTAWFGNPFQPSNLDL